MLIDDDVHPESLMEGISDTPLAGKLAVSLGVHAAVVLLTSIGFIALCVKHGSLDPRAVIRKAKEDAEKEKKAAERKKREEEALAKQKARGGAPAEAGGDGAAPAPTPAAKGDGKSEAEAPVEKRTTETSDERPDVSDLQLDLDDL